MTNEQEHLCPCCGRTMEGFAFRGFTYDDILSKCGKLHKVGNMTIDFEHLTFLKNGKPIKLTKNAWKYLAVLISFQGNPCNRETLYRMVCGLDGGTTRSVDTFVALLRHHLGQHIETIHGLGYRWTTEPVAKKVATAPPQAPQKATSVKIRAVPRSKPVKAIKRIDFTPPPLSTMESSERIYRIRGTFVQWDGTGTMPELIAAHQQVHGDLPSFLTLPHGAIKFTVEDSFVTWKGIGPLPAEVMHHLDEHKSLPPWIRIQSKTEGRKVA